MGKGWTRRSVLAGAAVIGPAIIVRPTRAADYKFAQYHNQAASGTLHKNLNAMWQAIAAQTNGRVEATVYAENNKLPGGDPDALKMLIAGEIQFFTLMGGIIGTVVPVAESQQLPFAFSSPEVAHKAVDGPLGKYIGEEMAAKGMHLFPVAGFDNGMRQVATISRPIAEPQDFAGMKMRVPPSPVWVSLFTALGASPTSITINELYSALQTKIVDGQENPLTIIESGKYYEVQKYCSITEHMWDGLWIIANGKRIKSLPADDLALITKSFEAATAKQRAETEHLNVELEGSLKSKGLVFNHPDKAPFRQALTKAGFYADWKQKYGPEAWAVLEKYSGSLA